MSLMRIGALAALMLLMLPQSISIAQTPRFEGVQLVRFVLETTKFSEFDEYKKGIIAGTLSYDDKYRHPHLPPGPAVIDCASTRRIGVTFLLKRKTRAHPETATAYMHWTHSNAEIEKDVQDHSHRKFFRDGEDGILVSESIELTDAMRVNGIISLRVVVGTHEVLWNSFALASCQPDQ